MIGRAIAWPLKALALLFILLAAAVTGRPDETLKEWMNREFL